MLARGLQDSKHIPILSQGACKCKNWFGTVCKRLANTKIHPVELASGLQIPNLGLAVSQGTCKAQNTFRHSCKSLARVSEYFVMLVCKH